MILNHRLQSPRVGISFVVMEKEDFIAAGSRLYGRYGWQAELAQKLGMSPATINRYAMGKLRIPSRMSLMLKALEEK